jgi:hypothetical protein
LRPLVTGFGRWRVLVDVEVKACPRRCRYRIAPWQRPKGHVQFLEMTGLATQAPAPVRPRGPGRKRRLPLYARPFDIPVAALIVVPVFSSRKRGGAAIQVGISWLMDLNTIR